MTPEELDELERMLSPFAVPFERWTVSGRGVDSRLEADNGASYAMTRSRAELTAALHNAAPALIAAARQVSGYQAECHEIDQVLGRALGYPGNPDGADGICTGEHTPASLACEAAREVERLRAFVPRWKREDGMWTLRVGTLMVARISQFDGGIVPVVREDNGGRRVLDSAPDVESAARAVCDRLGIPDVEVPS